MLSALLARLEKPPRTASLIITLFGDVAVPRGGALWLGSLGPILDAFGIKPGQLRTAMSRLTEEGWLAREMRGRLSHHRLGPRGEAEFATAAARIYAAAPPPWDGTLRLVLAEDAAARDALARAGFGVLAPGLYCAAGAEPPPGLPLLRASGAGAAAFAARAFPLAALGAAYQRFHAAFAPLAGATPPPLEALTLRIALVHEYRRLVLRDPALPTALLPPDWPGTAARALAAALYRRWLAPSEAWLDAHAQGPDGPLPPAGAALAERFNVLQKSPGIRE